MKRSARELREVEAGVVCGVVCRETGGRQESSARYSTILSAVRRVENWKKGDGLGKLKAVGWKKGDGLGNIKSSTWRAPRHARGQSPVKNKDKHKLLILTQARALVQ